MNTRTFTLSAIAALVLAASGVTSAVAQPARAAAADTSASGAKQPKGELSTPNQDKGTTRQMNTQSRQTVKDEAKAANAAGTIPKGEQSTPSQGKTPTRPMSSASRANVKSEAAAANKSGMEPKGELSVKDQDKGGSKGTKP